MSKTSRPEPPVLKRDGFQIVGGCFSAAGISRVEGARLKELFNPESLRLKRDQKAAQESAKTLFRKPFFAGQLRFYGIKFASNATVDNLRTLLKDAVVQGKCNKVPASVVTLEQSMRRDYEPLHETWNSEVSAYDATERQKDDENFAKCTTAGERATCDLDRFMEQYFLTNGLPDKRKTAEPLALHGFSDRWELHAKAEPIPGLHTRSGGSGAGRVVCIGWHLDAVLSLAGRISADVAKVQRKQDDAKWEEKLEAHRQYVARSSQDSSSQKKRGRPAKKATPQLFNLERCLGSYIIQCKDVTDGWDHIHVGDLTLDVCKGEDGILTANFDFGIIEGTMLLSLSEEKLDAIADHESDDDEASDSEISESEASQSDESDSDNFDDGKKGKRTKTFARAATRDRTDQSTDPNAKRRKVTPSLSRRVYYRLRGRETGEGEIFSDPESGYLDFVNVECTEFAGMAYDFPYVSKNVKFHGYKVSDKAQKRPEE